MKYKVTDRMFGQVVEVEAKSEKDAVDIAARKIFGLQENQGIDESMIKMWRVEEA